MVVVESRRDTHTGASVIFKTYYSLSVLVTLINNLQKKMIMRKSLQKHHQINIFVLKLNIRVYFQSFILCWTPANAISALVKLTSCWKF